MQLSELLEALEKAQRTAAEQQAQREEADEEIVSLTEQVRSQKEEMEARSEELEQVKKTLQETEEKVAGAENDREESDAELVQLTEQTGSQQEEIEQLKSDLKEAREEKVDSLKQSSAKELEMQRGHDQLVAELEALKKQARVDVLRHVQEIRKARGRTAEAEDEAATLTEALEISQRRNQQLEQQLAEKEAARKAADERMQRALGEVKRLEVEAQEQRKIAAPQTSKFLFPPRVIPDSSSRIRPQHRPPDAPVPREVVPLSHRLDQVIGIVRPLRLTASQSMRFLCLVQPDLESLRDIFIAANMHQDGHEFAADNKLFNNSPYSEKEEGAAVLQILLKWIPDRPIAVPSTTDVEIVLAALANGIREEEVARMKAEANRSLGQHAMEVIIPPLSRELKIGDALRRHLSSEEYERVLEKAGRELGLIHRLAVRHIMTSPQAKQNLIAWYLRPHGPLPDPLRTIRAVRMKLWEGGREHLNSAVELEMIRERLGAVA